MQRYVHAAYSDGQRLPRGGMASSEDHCKTGNGSNVPNKLRDQKCSGCHNDPTALLPNPRMVSWVFDASATKLEDKFFTFMTIMFSQFLDHDMTLAPELQVEGGCCTGYYAKNPNRFHPVGKISALLPVLDASTCFSLADCPFFRPSKSTFPILDPPV